MKKPEILVAPENLEEIKLLASAGADAFVIGDSRFALVLKNSFNLEDLKNAVNLCNGLQKSVYLLIDAIFPNAFLDDLSTFLNQIKDLKFDAIRVADLGAYMKIKEILPQMKLHLVDGFVLTNHFTVNYWHSKGMTRARLAHELTLEEVLEIKKFSKPEIEVLVQGAPLMFTSRRKLIENYLDFKKILGKDITVSDNNNFLFDSERDLHYPIMENPHGTHIYGGKDVCMIDDLKEMICAGIDSFYIEGYTYHSQNYVEVVKLYRAAIDLVNADAEKYQKVALALYNETLKFQGDFRKTDRGFYYKPTIYKNQMKAGR